MNWQGAVGVITVFILVWMYGDWMDTLCGTSQPKFNLVWGLATAAALAAFNFVLVH